MTTIKATGRDLELKGDQDIVFYPADNIWISQGTKLIFEGTVPDNFEAKLQATSVTADRDIILPDISGTIALTDAVGGQVFTNGTQTFRTTSTLSYPSSTSPLAVENDGGDTIAFQMKVVGNDLNFVNQDGTFHLQSNFTEVLTIDPAGTVSATAFVGDGSGLTGVTVSGPSASISGATQANPVVITTATAHSFTNGSNITITDVVGMTELNGNNYYANVLTSTTFALYSDAGLTTSVDGTAFTAYVSDGVATQEILGGGGGGTGISSVVADTTPQLGGNLDLNGYDINGAGNININGDISSTSAGTPTITSNTVINLTAGTGATDRVTVTQSPFKLASFTTTQRDAKTSEDGDLIYNSSNNQFELYTNTSWAAMTKVVYDNLLPSSDFVDQITNIWSANPTTPADFAAWAQTIASDGFEYGNIDLSTTPPTIRSADSLAWLNISTNNSPDPAQVTRWLDIVLPSLIEQSWFDVHTSNLVNGNVFSRVSDDATPKLGGALDADGKNIENLGQVQIGTTGAVVFEGFTDDAFETTLTVVDPTADRTIYLPDATGFVALLGSTQDFTASQTFSSDLVVGSVLKVEGSIWEEYIAGTVTTNTLTVDILGSANTTQTVSGLSANFEVAFTNAPTSGTYTIGVALIITQGASAYIPDTCTVNGTSVTIKWLNASAPTGNANQTDVVNFTLVNNSGTYDVLAGLSTFG